MLTLSVIIITYNEAHRLRPCLESMAWADEIVVVDGGSTDGTEKIAHDFTPHVYVSDLLGPDRPGGFSDQRNFALGKASGDWVLFLDADERMTPELAQEIKTRLLGEADEGYSAYRLRRHEHFFGVYSPYTHGQSWLVRIVRRGMGEYDGRAVHEGINLTGSLGDLEGYLLHYSKDSIAQYVATMNRYTSLEAEEKIKTNAPLTRTPWPSIIHGFSYRYFHLGSYREGTFGLLMSLMFAFYNYLTWSKHWELYKDKGIVPGQSHPALQTTLTGTLLRGLWLSFGKMRARMRGSQEAVK